MYSKNDYRYYLEHRLSNSDDYLAHYGVKGMKWKKHLKKVLSKYANFYKDSRSYNDGYRDGGTSKHIGVESKKNPNKYLEVSKFKYNDGSKYTNIYFSPTKKSHYKRLGRVRLNAASEGGTISIDTSSKKQYKKNNAEELGDAVRRGNRRTAMVAVDAVKKANKRNRKQKNKH